MCMYIVCYIFTEFRAHRREHVNATLWHPLPSGTMNPPLQQNPGRKKKAGTNRVVSKCHPKIGKFPSTKIGKFPSIGLL